jgi:hypothetical protein
MVRPRQKAAQKYVAKEYTKKEALEILEDSDHSYLTPEAALGIQNAFKMTPHLEQQIANTGDPKGLTSGRVGKNERLDGYDAASLATWVCRHLGVSYVPKMGRGSLLRSACEALRNHLTEKGEI